MEATAKPASSVAWQPQPQLSRQGEAAATAAHPPPLAEPEQSSDVEGAEVPTRSADKLTRVSLSDPIDQFSRSASALDEPGAPPQLSASKARRSLLGELLTNALKEDSSVLLDDDTSGGLRNHFTLEELEAEAMAAAAEEQRNADAARKSKEHAERCEDISEGRWPEPRRQNASV